MKPKTTLVTNKMYAEFIAATGHCAPVFWPGEHPSHLVLGVSYNDATEYCEWANTRLPTEKELPIELIPYYFWVAGIDDTGFAIAVGGSWSYYARWLRCSDRVRYLPSDRNSSLGFRCVRAAKKGNKNAKSNC